MDLSATGVTGMPLIPQGKVCSQPSEPVDKFYTELRELINRYSKENGSDTPDFVLAEYLNQSLKIFDYAVRYRESTKTLIEPAEWGGVGNELAQTKDNQDIKE